ncbi:MAG TPA: hypothetical protein VMT12_11815 [Syntrophales bacterium]|nr:hypothetical protein [Syntrophales bacterium]
MKRLALHSIFKNQVIAYIDNQPENLNAMLELDTQKQILLLHAYTLFKSKRRKFPSHAVSGKGCDLTELIYEGVFC